MRTKIEASQYELSFHPRYNGKVVESVTQHSTLSATIYFTDKTSTEVSGLIAKILSDIE